MASPLHVRARHAVWRCVYVALLSFTGCVEEPPPAALQAPAAVTGSETSSRTTWARPDAGPSPDIEEIHDAMWKRPVTWEVFEAYKATLPHASGRYLFEGDMLLTEEELRNAVGAPAIHLGPVREFRKLYEHRHPGLPSHWRPEDRVLSYSLHGNLGADATRVQALLQQAIDDWDAACPGCITIKQVPSWRLSGTHFIVQRSSAFPEAIATSFFPYARRGKRILSLSPAFFELLDAPESSRHDPAGILLHELGHIFGYAHDPRGGTGCKDSRMERAALIPGTEDSESVMRQVCKHAPPMKLRLSVADREGHRRTYEMGQAPDTFVLLFNPEPAPSLWFD